MELNSRRTDTVDVRVLHAADASEVNEMLQDSFSERAVYFGRAILLAGGALALAVIASIL